MPDRNVLELESVTIRFAGDSGDGMQLTGTRFTDTAALLGNDNKRVSYTAAWALRKIGEPAGDALAGQLTGPDKHAHYPAAYALAPIKSFRRVEPWLKAMEDPDARVRYYAVTALGNIGDKKAADALAAHADFFAIGT